MKVNTAGGKAFADFMLAPDTQRVIAEFGKDKFGEALFVPMPASRRSSSATERRRLWADRRLSGAACSNDRAYPARGRADASAARVG